MRPLRARLPVVAACLSLGTACSPSADPTPVPEGVMSREEFVDVYVALRRAGLQSGRMVAPPSERERILAEHATSEDALLEFAEVHGADAAFMKEVWDQVEQRLQQHDAEMR